MSNVVIDCFDCYCNSLTTSAPTLKDIKNLNLIKFAIFSRLRPDFHSIFLIFYEMNG